MPTYRGRDGRWRYRFAYRGRRKGYNGSAPKGANTEKVAARMEREHLERVMNNQFVGEMPTVTKFITQFLEYQKPRVKPLTYESQSYHLELHTQPILGKKRLDEVETRDLDQLVTEWSKTAEDSTVNTRLGTVMRMLSLAEDWKIIRAVPTANFLKVAHEAIRFLSQEEATALLEAAKRQRKGNNTDWSGEWHSMVLVGLRTGLRIGELRALQWADVNLGQRIIHVTRSDPGRSDIKATSTKGNKGRVLPLTPDAYGVLVEILAASRAQHGAKWHTGLHVWPAPTKWRGKERGDRARSGTSCQSTMQRVTKRAKLTDVGWHTLRHTFASWLVMRGVPLRVVQELLGHASIKMTERYAHLAPGFAHASAVASLDIPLITPHGPALPPGSPDDDS